MACPTSNTIPDGQIFGLKLQALVIVKWETLFVALFPGHVGRLGLKVHVARLKSAMTPRSETLQEKANLLTHATQL